MSQELKNQIAKISQESSGIVVKNENDFLNASDYLKANKLIQKRVSELLDPGIKQANIAHKAATAHKKELLAPLVESAQKVSSVIGKYLAEKEKIRLAIQRQEQKALQAEADKKAEMLKDLGFEDEAKMALQEPILSPIKIEKTTPKTGVSLRKDFDFEIIDATQIKGEFMMPDEKKIRQIVKSLGINAQSLIGGIRVIEKFSTNTRVK